ncbi:DNA internalization-related competence protein ComEC/Rec2 [Sporosarcina sp. ITBMC105]
MIGQIRLIYVMIPLTVSAFAVYGQVHLLALNLLLIPIFLRRKQDYLTPIIALATAIISYTFFSTQIPFSNEFVVDVIDIRWTDKVKVDGGSLKGFAKTQTGDVVYVIYRIESEREKEQFQSMHIPSLQMKLAGTFKQIPESAHAYSFQMDSYLRMNGAANLFESDMLVEVRYANGLYSSLSAHRWSVQQHIERLFPVDLQTEAKALLIGDRSGMSDELAATYRTLGITHLFAISGLHVGLLTYLIRVLLIRMNIRMETVDTLLVILLPLYAVLAGGAPSVWRAVLVTMLVLLTATGKMKMKTDDALALSAILFISWQPYVVFQPGFQMSYVAAFSLVYSSTLLSRAQSPIVVAFLVTAITQIALYPILLVHFYELSLSSFFVNLLYVPLYATIILPANILLLVLTYVAPVLASISFTLYTPLRVLVEEGTFFLASLPFQLWTPGKPHPLFVTMALIGSLVFFIKIEQRRNLFYASLFLLVPALCIQFTPYLDSTLRVTYVDVGQGDAIVIELPSRKGVYVVDTGGVVRWGEKDWRTPEKEFEVGRRIVFPYLKGKGITKVDKLILTHADSDHMEAADEIIEEIEVVEIHIAPHTEKEETMKEVLELARAKQIPVLTVSEGATWSNSSISFTYLAPDEGIYKGNDSSLVLFMQTTGPNFLFTGDLERDGESKLIRDYRHINWGEVFLKAGHHGSRTSSSDAFIEMIRPTVAILSYGKDNRYGHPHQEVVETFHKYNVKTYSTAEDGSITISVNKGKYVISATRN